MKPHTCPKCNGEGGAEIPSPNTTNPTVRKPCFPCGGTGLVWEPTEVSVVSAWNHDDPNPVEGEVSVSDLNLAAQRRESKLGAVTYIHPLPRPSWAGRPKLCDDPNRKGMTSP